MALTLKTTGPAAKALSVIAVDDNGDVKDFVTGRTITYNAAIAAPRIGTATWKGVTRSHFKTDYSPDAFSPRGAVYGATVPPVPMGAAGNGVSWFCACNQLVEVPAGAIFWLTGDNNQGARIGAGSKLEVLCGNTSQGLGTTTLLAATKMSFGFNQKYSTTGLPFFFGLESGALAADGTYNEGGFGSATVLSMFGGHAGYGSARGEYFVHAVFSDAVLLTLAEMQSLHNDWFGTLFEAVTATTQTNTTTLSLTANATQTASNFTNTTQTNATTLTLTANATQSYNVTVRQVSTSPDALGHVFGGSAGTPWANLTGINWYWQDTFGGPVLDSGSGASTNGSGVLTVNIPNTALANGARGYLSLQVPDLNPAVTWPRMLLNLPVTVA